MTRAEVVKHLVTASDEHSYSSQILRDRILDELESLGLVKFDPPIDRRKWNAVDEALHLVKTHDLPCSTTTFIQRLESNGYKIVERN